MHGSHLGDFQTSCAILFSGHAYAKIAVLLTSLHMKPPNRTLFYKIHTHYAVKAVDDLWSEVQAETLEGCKGRDIVLLGELYTCDPTWVNEAYHW